MEELMESSPSIEALNLLLYAMLKTGQIKLQYPPGAIKEVLLVDRIKKVESGL